MHVERSMGVGQFFRLVMPGLVLFAGCGPTNPPATVQKVDLPRYMGVWYEVARLPQGFQKGCTATRAEYFLREDGKVDVLNVCRFGSTKGPIRVARGTARVVEPATGAKLKVSFAWPFEGDYWIFRLDEDYRYAAVGSPDRKALWFLSREPSMPEDLYRRWVDALRAEGFPVDDLKRTGGSLHEAPAGSAVSSD